MSSDGAAPRADDGGEAGLRGAGKAVPGAFSAGWGRKLAQVIDHVYLRTRVEGRECVPRKGPVILAANHSGLLDGPVVLGAAPRGAHFLIKQELARGLGGRILLAAGQIPVDRAAGRGALEAALGVLRAGRVVGIFPEGARGAGRVASIHAGVAWLAVHSGAPVVPVVCLGSRREGESVHKVTPPRRRVYVGFGQPVDLAAALALPAARDRVAAAMEAIREALEAHVAGAEASTGLRLPRE